MNEKEQLATTLELIQIPGWHPQAGLVSVVKSELDSPHVQEYLRDLLHDAPVKMREAIEKLLGRETVTQSIKVPK